MSNCPISLDIVQYLCESEGLAKYTRQAQYAVPQIHNAMYATMFAVMLVPCHPITGYWTAPLYSIMSAQLL